ATTAPAAKPTTAPAASPAIAASPAGAAASPAAAASPVAKPAASPAASPVAGTSPAAPGGSESGFPHPAAAAGGSTPRRRLVTNLAGLIFDEDKAGYLAGYLAGSLTKSGTVGQVLGTPLVPPVEKFGVGYINGAKAAKSGVKVLSACHPGGLAKGFTDPQWGKDTVNQEMSQNADVVFAAGGQTGNGGLLAVADKNGAVLGIGVDTDQYLSLPEAKSILVS